MANEPRTIKHRNIFLVYLFGIITLGIYFIYWQISTKRDMNSLGADIPHSILMFIPLVNFYWLYKYMKGYTIVKGEGSPFLWFIISLILWIIVPGLVQSMLNQRAGGAPTQRTMQPGVGQGMPPQPPIQQPPMQPQMQMQQQAPQQAMTTQGQQPMMQQAPIQ